MESIKGYIFGRRGHASASLSIIAPERHTRPQLDAAAAFEGLTPKERLYAHSIARASWSVELD